jgi:glycosyltransferase involved in cell wall biosynthesis
MLNRRKIKILVDGHIFDHSMQGIATYINGLYNALVKFDEFEITICACDCEVLRTHFPDERFKFRRLTSHSKYKRLAFEIPNLIKVEKFDYAHFQYIVPLVKHCKFINTIHDLLFLDFPQYFPVSYRIKNKYLFKFSAKRSDIILTVSEYSKQALVEKFNLRNDHIHITPNAVKERVYDSLDVKRHFGLDKYLLYVSRFEPRKNQKGLLEAFINLDLFSKGYKLVFVGSKKEKIERDYYEELRIISDTRSGEGVKFYESLSDQELAALYQHASCFVFPSLAEGFGIPPIEAALNNCKVVCSNLTAMHDFQFFKYHIDPRNQFDLENSIRDILDDKNYDYEYCKIKVKELFSWDKIAFDFRDIIHKNFTKTKI